VETAPVPAAFEDLHQVIGREIPLNSFHGLVRRAAQSVRSVREYGTVLVTCSDEFNGEVREGFDRDVARPLMARRVARNRRTFALSNLGGRVEPGALSLAGDHFDFPGANTRLIVVEIVSHVGRRKDGQRTIHGEIDRFGRSSSCCGALHTLLEPPAATGAVHYPWLEHLESFFGQSRLVDLRAIDPAIRLVPAAIVHAALQAESIVTDALRAPLPEDTWILVASAVSVNKPGIDGALGVGYHLLRTGGGEVSIERGFSLRTTPSALSIATDDGHLRVEAGFPMESAPSTPRFQELDRDLSVEVARLESPVPLGVAPEHEPAVRERLEEARDQAELLRKDPVAWRVYARPLLRSLFQGLTLVAPEVGLAAMLVESGSDWARARHRKHLLEVGPSSPDAVRVLHEVESSIQQLSHREAQDVLDVLIAEGSPLV
jgi:hypothetical protein